MTELLEANQDALRRLAALDGGPVLSVYISLEAPEVRTPETLGLELESRLKEAEGQLRPGVPEDAAAGFDAALAAARTTLGDVPLSDHTLRAVAVFCGAAGEPLLFGLQRPIEAALAASFAPRPAIEPMLEALEGDSWAVALVSRKHGRVFRGGDAALVEVADVDDDVHRRHSQGGWSQARYQRGVEKETGDHVGHVCDLLFALHERRPIAHLAIGGPEEILPTVEEKLHPYLRERLAGHVHVDVEHSTVADVLDHLRPLAAEQRAKVRKRAIERLEAGLGTGDQAVAGGDEVTAALRDRRVEVLLLSAADSGEEAERAAEEAVAQDAEVLVFEGEELERFGGIAALLRF
jgi:peptide chain release factor subunit 1